MSLSGVPLLPALRDRPQRVQLVGGPVSSPVKRDSRGTLEQGRSDSGVSCHLPFFLWDRPPLRSPSPRSTCCDGREAFSGGGPAHSGLPGLPRFGTESPTSWVIPLQAWWLVVLPVKATSVLGATHTQCHLREGERPTDHRVPPLEESGTPPVGESCQLVLSGATSTGTELT